jgi:hypothetical protein
MLMMASKAVWHMREMVDVNMAISMQRWQQQ